MTHSAPRRLLRPAVVAAACLTTAGGVALGVLPQQQGTVDLLTQANVVLSGVAANDYSGYSVAPAGDVNADGHADIIVGAPFADPSSRADAGTSYVVFGQATPSDLDLGALGSDGFRIDGAAAGDQSGISVASAGDINADGRADLLVGARNADPLSRTDAGAAYVVYGQATPSNVDLSALGSGGFRISGAAAGDASGSSVSAGGDVNGDSRADVIVSAPAADPSTRTSAGSTYVVYGQATPSDVDLSALSANGVRIDGATANDQSGFSAASAGDVNGDGRADVIVGARNASPFSRSAAGSTYVVFGQATPSDVDLSALGASGFRIDGAAAADQSGWSVASAGYVNGDIRADVIVGAYLADPSARGSAGSSYVIYGRATPSNVDLNAIGGNGFRIDGAVAGDQSGVSVAGAGDVNGDGRADVIVGARNASPGVRTNGGSSYVVYGQASPSNVDLSTLGVRGFRIDGAAGGDQSGVAVAPAGDINSDGRPDVVVGAYQSDPSFRSDAGSAYVVFGFGSASVSYAGAISATVGAPISPLTPTVSRTGAATFSVSPTLPTGLTLNAATGVISGTPTVAASGTYTVTMSDLSGTATATLLATVNPVSSGSPGASPPSGTPASQAPSSPSAASSAAAPALSVAQLASLKARVVCKGAVCTTRVTPPTGAVRIAQSATAPGRKPMRARCVAKASRKRAKAARPFVCTLRVTKGTWAITTSAGAKDGTTVAQAVVTKRVK